MSSDNSWETVAERHQQEFCDRFGISKWESYHKKLPSICNLLLSGWCDCFSKGLCTSQAEMIYLKRKIGYALFGEPSEEPNISNNFIGYGKRQVKAVEKIYSNVVGQETDDKVLMSIVVVILEGCPTPNGSVTPFPVFRIPNPASREGSWFVDHVGRVYKGWNYFLKNNILPKGKYCYPKDGIYCCNSAGNVELCFGKTPASTLARTVGNAMDVTSSVVGLGAELTSIALISASSAAATVAAPVCVGLGAAAGSYSLVRSIMAQADRGLHEESINVTDREALKNWLSIGGSVLGLGSVGATTFIQQLARKGNVASKWATGAANGLKYSSLTVNGMGIAESIYTLKERRDCGGELNILECCQLGAHILFFLHSVLNTKSAQCIFEETQMQVLEDHKSGLRSNRHRKMFEGIKRETMKNENATVGRAKVIKSINHISDADQFYASVIKSRKILSRAGIKLKFEESGVGINCPKGNSAALKTLIRGPLDFQKELVSLFSDNNKIFLCNGSRAQRHTFFHSVSTCFNELGFYLKSFLDNLAPQNSSAAYELVNLLQELLCKHLPGGEYLMDLLKIIFNLKRCRSVEDYAVVAGKFFDLINKIYDRELSKYLQRSDPATTDYEDSENNNFEGTNNDGNSNSSSDERKGISVEFSITSIFKDISLPIVLYGMELEDLQMSGEEVYHFPEHRSWGENGELSVEEYLIIGQNVLGIPNINCAKIVQESPSSFYVYFEGIGVVFVSSDYLGKVIIIRKAVPQNMMDIDA